MHREDLAHSASAELNHATANCDPRVFVFVHDAGYHDVNSLDTVQNDNSTCGHWYSAFGFKIVIYFALIT